MTIIVGHLPTPEGQAALQSAVAEATLRRQRLVVVDLSRGSRPLAPATLPADVADVRDTLRAEGLDLHVEPPSALEPSEELVRAAQAHDASLIVIGLRHRTPVGKFLLGSHAQRVLLEATCPVLAVKARR
jgi:nucleotide-binding universal stress UspA family protein